MAGMHLPYSTAHFYGTDDAYSADEHGPEKRELRRSSIPTYVYPQAVMAGHGADVHYRTVRSASRYRWSSWTTY